MNPSTHTLNHSSNSVCQAGWSPSQLSQSEGKLSILKLFTLVANDVMKLI